MPADLSKLYKDAQTQVSKNPGAPLSASPVGSQAPAPAPTPTPDTGGRPSLDSLYSTSQRDIMAPTIEESASTGGGFSSFMKNAYNTYASGARKVANTVGNIEVGAAKGIASTIGSVAKNVGQVTSKIQDYITSSKIQKNIDSLVEMNAQLTEEWKALPVGDPRREKLKKIITTNNDTINSMNTDIEDVRQMTSAFDDKPEFLKPKGTSQKVGYVGEQIAEFAVPSGTIKRGEAALKTFLKGTKIAPGVQKAISVIGGALMEGASAATVASAQTGNSDKEASEKLNDVKNAAFWGTILAVPFKAYGAYKEGASSALKETATKKASQALGATGKQNKELSDRVVPELLKRRVTFVTRKGLENKAMASADDVGQQIDDAFNALPPETKVTVAPIISKIEDAKSKLIVKGTDMVPDAAADQFKALQNIQKEILTLTGNGPKLEVAATEIKNQLISAKQILKELPDAPLPEVLARAKINIVDGLKGEKLDDIANLLNDVDITKFKSVDDLGKAINDAILDNQSISAESLRSFRQIMDKAISRSTKTFGLTGTEGSKLAAQKSGTNAIRDVLADEFPDIAKLNAEFNFWKNVQTVVGATVQRTKSQAVPLSQEIAEGAGAVVASNVLKGGTLQVALGALGYKYLKAAIQSPGWRMMSAVTRARLADAIMSGAGQKAADILKTIVIGSVARPSSGGE